jgi:hypothetical protein
MAPGILPALDQKVCPISLKALSGLVVPLKISVDLCAS